MAQVAPERPAQWTQPGLPPAPPALTLQGAWPPAISTAEDEAARALGGDGGPVLQSPTAPHPFGLGDLKISSAEQERVGARRESVPDTETCQEVARIHALADLPKLGAGGRDLLESMFDVETVVDKDSQPFAHMRPSGAGPRTMLLDTIDEFSRDRSPILGKQCLRRARLTSYEVYRAKHPGLCSDRVIAAIAEAPVSSGIGDTDAAFAILNHAWETRYRRFYLADLLVELAFLALLLASVVKLRQAGEAPQAAVFAMIACFAKFLLDELCRLNDLLWSERAVAWTRGTADLLVLALNGAGLVVLQLRGDLRQEGREGHLFVVAAMVLVWWLHCVYSLRAFSPFGQRLIPVVQVFMDALIFAVVGLCILVGCALALYVLGARGTAVCGGIGSSSAYAGAVQPMLSLVIGDAQMEGTTCLSAVADAMRDPQPSGKYAAAYLIAAAVSIFVMSLLVGVLASSYERFQEQSRALFLCERAVLMRRLAKRPWVRDFPCACSWSCGSRRGCCPWRPRGPKVPFKKGEVVELWDVARKEWVENAYVEEVLAAEVAGESSAIPAGSLVVSLRDGTEKHTIKPILFRTLLRRPRGGEPLIAKLDGAAGGPLVPHKPPCSCMWDSAYLVYAVQAPQGERDHPCVGGAILASIRGHSAQARHSEVVQALKAHQASLAAQLGQSTALAASSAADVQDLGRRLELLREELARRTEDSKEAQAQVWRSLQTSAGRAEEASALLQALACGLQAKLETESKLEQVVCDLQRLSVPTQAAMAHARPQERPGAPLPPLKAIT